MLDLLGVIGQAQNTDESSFQRYVSELREAANGPLDPRLEAAKQQRTWAELAAMSGDTAQAKAFLKHAEYLEFCHRHGLFTEA